MNPVHRLLCASLALVLSVAPNEVHSAGKPPNIVLFLADDLGWTGLNGFGSDFYETPNLDRLAEQGMKFTDAYAACTVCSPTRASIMTGMYPARLHLTSFIPGQDRPFAKLTIPDWTKGLDDTYTTLPEALREGGYRTVHVGKWHLNFPNEDEKEDPLRHGFDFTQDKPPGTKGYHLPDKVVKERGLGSNYLTDYLADVAVEQISKESDKPFFLYFAFHVPHTPIEGREDLVAEFEKKADPKAVHHNPTYAAMVKSMDMAVGRVLETLEKQGIEGETMVLFTSDNGGLTQRNGKHDDFTENLPLRRGKGSAYEGGVRVPAIVKWPGVTKPGSVCGEPVMTTDLYPTLLEVCGVKGDAKHNQAMDGVSMVPLLKDGSATLGRDLFWHFPHYHAGGDSPYTAVRSGDWRLIEFHEDGSLELYDLSADIGETENLAQANADVTGRLHRVMQQWREDVGAQMPTPNPKHDPAREMDGPKKGKGKGEGEP